MINRRRLKAFLVESGMSQIDAAKKIKIHKSRFNSYLNGLINLSSDDVKRICSVMGISYKSYINDNEIRRVEQ